MIARLIQRFALEEETWECYVNIIASIPNNF